MTEYAGNSRGAVWNKWDLHVHTPASVEQHYGDGNQRGTWESFTSALAALPPEIRAVGITDYFTVEGYRRVREAKEQGALPNLDLILPVVELRLPAFAGHSELRKINYHVVFSDELSADDIQRLFLDFLTVEIPLENGAAPWSGCLGTADGREDFGKAYYQATPEGKRPKVSFQRIGLANAALDVDAIERALKKSALNGRFLTAIGYAEWNGLRWDGAGGAPKRGVIERADFALTAAPSVAKYDEHCQSLRANNLNHRLFHASDAHYYADSGQPNRLGQTSSWVKADLTFRGLCRAVARFEDRVYVGDVPPKLELIGRNKTKYIRRVEVGRRPGATLDEPWFDTVTVELNPDLVAIIGNQGSGKTALTDVIALCGGSKVDGFGFLNAEKFCDKQNKAGHFVAKLVWEDGEPTELALDAGQDSSTPERVRYVPQGFFDIVTNETAVLDNGRFYGEIKKAVFSHVAPDDRLGCGTFDDLLTAHTRASLDEATQVRQQLRQTNAEIVSLERACTSSAVARVEGLIAQRKADLTSLRENQPAPPATGPIDADDTIEQLRQEEARLRDEFEQLDVERGTLKRQRRSVQDALQRVATESRRVDSELDRIQQALDAAGVAIDVTACLSVKLNTKPLNDAVAALDSRIEWIGADLTSDYDPDDFDPPPPSTLAGRLAKVVSDREDRQRHLDSAASEYEAFRTRFEEWEAQIAQLNGDTNPPRPDSLRALDQQLVQLRSTKPNRLKKLREKRHTICAAIYAKLTGVVAAYREIAKPVQAHIAANELARDRYRVSIEVSVAETGLADRLFACVAQSTGTFAKKDLGRERLRQLVAHADLSTAEGATEFAEQLLDRLTNNHNNDPPTPIDLASGLKQGSTLQDVYDLVFGLEYLGPAFSLALNGQPLRQLSPGQRGILLLVFYLLVDRGDDPLIIDQPEGNLNNQSIVDQLVPVFRAAKVRRQIIIVTHNPNLAVVCDAEQIVHCELSIASGKRLTYTAGALENPKFTQLSLDVLEGTGPAFTARRETYELQLGIV
jgi:ABC-type lipoprotein export system ATPase subunit